MNRSQLIDLITQAEAIGDIATSMRLKGQLHQDNQRHTGRDGYVTMPDEAETNADSLRRQLEQALEHGDAHGASVFAGALAAPGVHGDGDPGPAASTADQGSRSRRPAVPPLEQALAQAERDGDWDEHGRLNLIKLAQYAKDNPHA